MTNTLHRYSAHYAPTPPADPAPVTDDYIVFAMATRDVNDDDLVAKYRTFARLALAHHPVNVGDATKGGLVRPDPALTPLAHWRRPTASSATSRGTADAERLVAGIEGHTTMAAVFARLEDMEGFVRDLAAADLGISINISAPVAEARDCCAAAGLTRHSVEFSLGFQGRVERLPDRAVLEISTMCGHGMVSHTLVRKLLDWVKEGRRTPGQATVYLQRFCSCGVFNPARAERLFEQARTSGA